MYALFAVDMTGWPEWLKWVTMIGLFFLVRYLAKNNCIGGGPRNY